MSRMHRCGWLLPLALAGVLPLLGAGADDDAPKGRQYALLVGVKNYDKDQLHSLQYTENDVNDLAAVLKDAGYKRVVLLTQSAAAGQGDNALLPTAKNVRKQLAAILDDRKADDSVLIAFSGHGVQFSGQKESYFCPMDADLEDAKSLVSLAEVYKALEGSAAGTKVLLADACRNDPQAEPSKDVAKVKLESRTRPQSERAPGGVAALFSCSEGQKSYESEKLGHGVFFHYVIEGLRGEAANKKGEVTLQSLASYVADEVPDAAKDISTAARQRPQQVGDLSGAVSLVMRSRPSPLDSTGEKGVSAADVRKAQEAWAKYLGRRVEEEDEIAPGVKMKFVLVPPGKFLMGTPKAEIDDLLKQRPDAKREWYADAVQHEVELTRAYYLGVYDVTQEQYEAVTGKTPSHFKGADLPVEQVSWEEADAFARKLTEKAKDGLVYRLPTEAEWEYCCRGGRPYSQPFGIGDGTSLSSREANFDGSNPYGGADKGPHLAKTSPVGSYQGNALGLFDMQGNVWQWCGDWYADYAPGKATDPTGPSSGPTRVFRGGCWQWEARFCRAAARGNGAPGGRNYDIGFRLARVPSGLGK